MGSNRSLGSLTLDLVARTLGFEQGLDKAARIADDRMKRIEKTAKRVGTVLGTGISAGVGIASAALVSWTRDVARMGQEVDRLSRLSGVGAEAFQKLAAGANLAGVSSEKLADIYKDTQDKIGDFLQTGGGPLADFFKKIAPAVGMTAEQFRNMSGPEALGAYFRALEQVNLSQSELTFYMEAIASDSSLLIPLLKNNAEGFRKAGDEAEKFGAILSQQTIESTKRLREQSVRLEQAFKGLKIEVAQQLLPSIEDLAELLNSAEFRSGFGTIIKGLADVTKFAAEATAMVGGLWNVLAQARTQDGEKSYQGLLQKRLRLMEQIGKLEAGTMPSLGVSREGQMELAESLRKELEITDKWIERRRLMDRVAAGDVRLLEPGQMLPNEALVRPFTAPTTGGGGNGKSQKDDTLARLREQMEEMKRLSDAQQQWSGRLADLQAQIEGPVAVAYRQHQVQMDELTQAYQTGEVKLQDYARLQEVITKLRDDEVKAIQAQLTPAQQMIEDLQFEYELLNLTNVEREKAIALRYANATAASEEGKKIADSIQRNYEAMKQMSETTMLVDGMKYEFQGFFADVLKGTSSIEDSFKNMLSGIGDMIANQIAKGWVEQLFGGPGDNAGGAFGGWLNTIAGVVSGGRANGGWTNANSIYEVNERGIEMATVRGRDYLLTGNQPVQITPHERLPRGGNTYNISVPVTGQVDHRTRGQIAMDTARQIRLGQRNG